MGGISLAELFGMVADAEADAEAEEEEEGEEEEVMENVPPNLDGRKASAGATSAWGDSAALNPLFDEPTSGISSISAACVLNPLFTEETVGEEDEAVDDDDRKLDEAAEEVGQMSEQLPTVRIFSGSSQGSGAEGGRPHGAAFEVERQRSTLNQSWMSPPLVPLDLESPKVEAQRRSRYEEGDDEALPTGSTLPPAAPLSAIQPLPETDRLNASLRGSQRRSLASLKEAALAEEQRQEFRKLSNPETKPRVASEEEMEEKDLLSRMGRGKEWGSGAAGWRAPVSAGRIPVSSAAELKGAQMKSWMDLGDDLDGGNEDVLPGQHGEYVAGGLPPPAPRFFAGSSPHVAVPIAKDVAAEDEGGQHAALRLSPGNPFATAMRQVCVESRLPTRFVVGTCPVGPLFFCLISTHRFFHIPQAGRADGSTDDFESSDDASEVEEEVGLDQDAIRKLKVRDIAVSREAFSKKDRDVDSPHVILCINALHPVCIHSSRLPPVSANRDASGGTSRRAKGCELWSQGGAPQVR